MFMVALCSCTTYRTSNHVLKKALVSNDKSQIGVGMLEDELTLSIRKILLEANIPDSIATSVALRGTGSVLLDLGKCNCR